MVIIVPYITSEKPNVGMKFLNIFGWEKTTKKMWWRACTAFGLFVCFQKVPSCFGTPKKKVTGSARRLQQLHKGPKCFTIIHLPNCCHAYPPTLARTMLEPCWVLLASSILFVAFYCKIGVFCGFLFLLYASMYSTSDNHRMVFRRKITSYNNHVIII